MLGIYDLYEIKLFTFPDLILYKQYNFFNDNLRLAGYIICNEDIILNCFQRKPDAGKHDYEYWYSIYNIVTESITYNSYNELIFPPGVRMSLISNCNNVVFINDIDYTLGKVTCYNFNTLDVNDNLDNFNYFEKNGTNINFNSNEFIGQFSNISIYNSSGSNVGDIHNGIITQPNYSFQLPELPSGTYYLQCQLPNQNLNFNFVVVR